MSTNQPPSTAPGWYPDPWQLAAFRYFDGAQWTAQVHGDSPAAAAAAAAASDPVAIAAKRKRKRRRLIVGLSIGATAVVATAALVGSLVVAPEIARAQVYTDISPVYDYTNDQHVARDHEFEFPADYDLDAVDREHAQPDEPDPETGEVDEYADPYAFQVYVDRELTTLAEFRTFQFEPGEPVKVSGSELAEATYDFQDITIRERTNALEGWGQFSEYFLVQRVSRDGSVLAKPIITRFTIEGEYLPSPQLTFDTPAGDGSLQVSWQEVPEATEYLVTTVEFDAITGYHYYRVIGRTNETTWSSSTAAEDAGRPMEQNAELKAFTGPSADAVALGSIPDPGDSRFGISVLATDGTHFSPYLYHDLVAVAGALPYEWAFTASRELKSSIPGTDMLDGIQNVQRRLPFTSLDGATRSTVAYIDEAADIYDRGDRWAFVLRGRGTVLSEVVEVSKASTPDPFAAIAQFNAEAQAAAPPTGMPTFELVAAPIDEAVTPVSEAPATPYPVFGSTEFTRYLAAHLIAGTEYVDISAFVDQPGAPAYEDAVFEASDQNPYARDLEGIGASGTTLRLTYDDAGLDEAGQAELQAAVTQVVSATVTDGMSDAEKVTALNDWLIAHAEYDHEALAARDASGGTDTPEGFEDAWNATGVMLDQTGVCASYAAAFMALSSAAGVPTVVVTGDVVDGGRHAWNKVLVDGQWRAIDTTWNDSEVPNRFLLITDGEFTGSATRTEDQYWMIDSSISQYATP